MCAGSVFYEYPPDFDFLFDDEFGIVNWVTYAKILNKYPFERECLSWKVDFFYYALNAQDIESVALIARHWLDDIETCGFPDAEINWAIENWLNYYDIALLQ